MIGWKRRSYVPEAVAFICGTNKLKSQQEMLERMQDKLVSSLKKFTVHERNEILCEMRVTELAATKVIEAFQDELITIFDLMRDVSHEVKDDEKLKSHSITYFRQKLTALETKIYKLKEECTRELNKLEDEEGALTVETEFMETRMENWGKTNKLREVRRAQSASKINCSCTTDQLCPEIRNFSQFVQRYGGHNGGWKEEDHLMYLKFRQKHGPKETAVLLNQNLPEVKFEMNNRLFHPLNKRMKDSYSTEQQKIRKEQELQEKLEEEEMKKKINSLKRKEQEKRKAFLAEYRRERDNCEQALQIAKQTEEERRRHLAALQANSMLRQFRHEDMKYVLRRRDLLQQKQDSDSRSTTSTASSISVKVKRDPERLFQPTKVWQMRATKPSDDFQQDLVKPIIHLHNMPHLKIPKWRQGLTFDI
ncbi:coiled-coil domain-containing protein 112 [Nilaparvata lugens]|uniref:coiled-coil domain-containing protein 112 n=1 Tax=Nilaparvata lugens TaxID=108931 RepID=UPI00193CAB3C|nr:coiled-coil domain-containing protein 112 [Nilaparvata lugens]